MLRTMLLGLALLASAAWVQAQSQYPTTNSTQSGTSSSTTNGETMVQGCLQGSDGNYTLTSDAGTSYQLQGDTSKLKEHVGHEVQITGTPSGFGSAETQSSGTNPSTSTSSSASTGASTAHTLNVDKVKHVSKTCTNASK